MKTIVDNNLETLPTNNGDSVEFVEKLIPEKAE